MADAGDTSDLLAAGPDPLPCTACRIRNRPTEQPIAVPPPDEPWLT